MADSQGDISLIKSYVLRENTEIFTDNIINLTGITTEKVQTLGYIDTHLNFNNILIPHTLHVVPDDINLPSDGLLGRDFLKKYKCNIDYDEMTISMNYFDNFIRVPILNSPSGDCIVLPARAEVYRVLNLNVEKPTLINSQNIDEDVFISRSIIDKSNQMVKILNVSSETKIVKISDIETDSLENYIICRFNGVDTNNLERQSKLFNTLKSAIPQRFQKDLLPLCMQYSDIFAVEGDKMTTNNFYEQKLTLTDKTPVYIKNYRTPHAQKTEINRQIEKLKENDLIEPSYSNYNSPLLLVPKRADKNDKSKKWRLCVDFRSLNKKLVADKHPLPRIDEILDNLGRTKYFSVLDLFSGFWQVQLHEKSRDLTSFSSDSGFYRWKVLPFGLKVAPNSFSRMMQIAFAGLDMNTAFVYVDDVIVLGKNETDHLANIRNVFDIFRFRNLKLNPLKCEFFKKEVIFLGHKCTPEGLLPDDRKNKAIIEYPVPKNADEAKRFVAFCNYYRRFIRGFSQIAKPLNDLSKKTIEFKWSMEAQIAFDKLKACLLSPQILAYPDLEREFMLTVDASRIGCGAVLSQIFEDGDRPISFASKTFNAAESKKATIEQELIAIHYAVHYFDPYLRGRHFTLRTDHKPLLYLFKLRDPSCRLTRLRIDLEEYDFTAIHIAGKKNVVADALSRISIQELKELQNDEDKKHIYAITRSMTRKNETKQTVVEEKTAEKVKVYEEINRTVDRSIPEIKMINNEICAIKRNNKVLFRIDIASLSINGTVKLETLLSTVEKGIQGINKKKQITIEKIRIEKGDPIFEKYSIEYFKKVGNKVLKEIEIIIFEQPKEITENDKKLEIMSNYHKDRVIGGHCGSRKLYAKIRDLYYWKNMTRDIAKFVKECRDCLLSKPKAKTKEQLKPTEVPQKSFDIIVVDTIGPLAVSNSGNRYAVTIMCALTKYLVCIPVANKTANSIARAIVDHFVLQYGTFTQMITDMGTEYRNAIFTELADILKFKQSFSTAYHHETVGLVERNHRTLNEYLRIYLENNMSDWDQYLKYFCFCYNNNPHTSFNEKFTPFELIFGKKAYLPDRLNSTVKPIYNIEDYSKEFKFRIQKSNEIVTKLLTEYKQKMKKIYDRKIKPIEIKLNDKILIKKEPYDKFKQIYDGPFTVISINEPNVRYKDKNDKIKEIHKNRIVKA